MPHFDLGGEITAVKFTSKCAKYADAKLQSFLQKFDVVLTESQNAVNF